MLAGIAGRAYNVEDAGLNQYVLVLAPTGRGKEAIASGIAKIMAAARPAAMHISNFKGPGQLVSGPGLFKFLARLSNPVVFSIIGEFGLMLKMMDAPNAAPNMAGLKKVLLELYSKSQHGAEFDPAAYSDRDNVTAVIPSPSYTIVGEGVPGTFYETLNEGMVASGLLPRFIVFETDTPRPRLNRQRITDPSPELIDCIGRLATFCMTLGAGNQIRHVTLSVEAEELFFNFEGFTHERWNAHNVSEISRELWTRAYMKALKLAALVAVGCDLENPVIGYDVALWATNLIVDQTNALIGKFESGETGEVAGDEVKQVNAILKIVFEYITGPYDRVSKYGITYEMHRDKVFSQSYLSRRIANLPTFKADRIGATNALKRVIAHLLEGDEIREVPKSQMQKDYGISPRSFLVSRPQRFFDAGSVKSGGAYER